MIWVGHVRHVVRCKHYATYYTWDTQTLVTLIKSRVWLLRSVANQHLPREHCINITRPKYIKVSSFINPIFCSGHFPREPEHPPYIRNLSLYWFYNSQKPSSFQWHFSQAHCLIHNPQSKVWWWAESLVSKNNML